MSDSIEIQAETLERLLPTVLRILFARSTGDPFADLPLGQLRVVRLLWKSEMTPSEIASNLRVSPQAVAQLLAKLESQGHVESESASNDRRSKVVKLTTTARSQMETRHRCRSEFAVRVLKQIEPDDRAKLIAILEEIVESEQVDEGTEK